MQCRHVRVSNPVNGNYNNTEGDYCLVQELLEMHIWKTLSLSLGFLGGSVVKNLPAMQETRVRSLGWEDHLEDEMAWRIPWTEEPGGLQSMGSKRVIHDWTTKQQQQSMLFGSIAGLHLGLFMLLFSHSVMSDSLWPHGLQYTRLPCPSLSFGACSNSCPLSWWCHSTISSSVVPFSPYLQSFPASGSFPMSRLFTSSGQSIAASASVVPKNIQDWFLLGLTGLISLQSKGLWRVFSNTTVWKHRFFSAQPSLWTNSHIYTWLLEKP